MKKVICLFLLLLSQLSINAQVDKIQTDSKETDYLFKYEEVVPSNIPQSVMWLNLKKWVSSSFNKYKYVVDIEDKDAGLMIIKWSAGAYHSFSMYTAITFQATFQIDIRDKKYRIKVYDAFADTEPDHLDHMRGATRKFLKMVEDDLKTTKEICKKLNYSEKWALDNHYISVMESEKELNHAMSLVRYDYTDCCKALLDSLKKAMNVEDDF
jgi:hypothetical protein